MNYLAWIANLGVVPLFLFFAFLFAPALFFLFALLILVTAVLETMVHLLTIIHYDDLKSKLLQLRSVKLANIPQCVKIFLCLSVGFVPSPLLRAENLISIPLNTGYCVPSEPIASYEIKNPELLFASYRENERCLYIEGQKIGETQILFQAADKNSKRQIKVSIAKGAVLLDINQYKNWLRQKNRPKTNLSPVLKREIWMEIHNLFYQSAYREQICEFRDAELICTHFYSDPQFLEFTKELKKNFAIHFISAKTNPLAKNYEVKLKLISLESSKNLDLHLGLDQLSANLSDFFSYSLKDIAGKNSVLLNEFQAEISILAEPILTALLGEENTFSIGQEIPFRIRSSSNHSTVQFKFAGLFLKFKLIKSGSVYKIEYETELSKPTSIAEELAISGNKQKGAVALNEEGVLKLFEIQFQTEEKNRSKFPGLSKIPIIGELFTSRSDGVTQKKIIGLISLKPL